MFVQAGVKGKLGRLLGIFEVSLFNRHASVINSCFTFLLHIMLLKIPYYIAGNPTAVHRIALVSVFL